MQTEIASYAVHVINKIKRQRKKINKVRALRVNRKKRIIPKSVLVVGGSYCLAKKLIKRN